MASYDLEKVRSEIPALQKSIYMNTGGVGPLPKSVYQYITDTYETAGLEGAFVPDVQEPIKEQLEVTRGITANFFNVSADEIAFVRCVSEGLSTVAYGMDWQSGDEVIVSDEEHPSGIMIWLSLGERYGVKVRKLPVQNGNDALLTSLRNMLNDHTRLLCLPHVTTDTGTKLPAADICRIAHEQGVPVMMDAAQSAGQFPVDLREDGIDFYSGTGHKWLLGGWGTGMLYVKRDWQDKIKVSWTGAHAGTWDRDTDDLVFEDSAQRYEFGGRHEALFNAMGKGIEFVDAVGMSKVEAHVGRLTAKLKSAIAEIPGATLRSPEDPEVSTGIVTFSVAGIDGTELNKQMWERWKVLGRPALAQTAMRLSTTFFSSDEEMDTIVSAISTLANENR